MDLNKKNIFYAIYFTLAVLMAATYFIYFPIAGFWGIAKNTLLMLIISVGSYISGAKIISLAKYEPENIFEKASLAVLLGFIPLAVLVFILGLFGLYTAEVAAAVTAGFLGFTVREVLWRKKSQVKDLQPMQSIVLSQQAKNLVKRHSEASAEESHSGNSFRREIAGALKFDNAGVLELLSLFFVLLSFLLVYLSCFSPSTYYDALVYHLAIPEIYIRAKGLVYIPYNMYSHFPQYGEMLWTFCLLLSDDSLCHLLNFTVYASFIIFCYGFLRKHFCRRTSLVTAALASSMPAIMLLSSSGYIDTLTMAYCGIMLALVWEYSLENDSKGILILSGAAAGFLMGIKYTGIIPAVIALFYTVYSRLRDKRTILRPVLFFIFTASLLVLPWLIKNSVNTGNPVFPFLNDVFSSGKGVWSKSITEGYFRTLSDYQSKKNILGGIVLMPWRAVTEVKKYAGGFDILGGFGWPFFFMLLPAGMYGFWKSRLRGFAVYCIILYTITWYFSAQVLRYYILSFFIIVLLAAFAVEELSSGIGKYIAGIFAGLFLLSHFGLYFMLQDTFDNWSVLIGNETREEFLKRRLPYYSSFIFANDKLPETSRILIFGEQRGYGLKREYQPTWAFVPYGDLAFDANPYVRALKDSSSAKEYALWMKKEKFTHIIFIPQEASRLDAGYKIYDFTGENKKLLEDFFKNFCRALFSDKNAVLYEFIKS